MRVNIKHLVIAAICALSVITSSAQMQRGEKSLGPKIGYVSDNQSLMAGLVFQYTFSKYVRISPEVSCVFRHKNRDAFMADINVHIPFGLETGKVVLYPLAGINYSSWAYHYSGDEFRNTKDVTTHDNKFGMNFGAGFELRCSNTLKLSLEAKYLLIKSYSHAQVGLGIAYIF